MSPCQTIRPRQAPPPAAKPVRPRPPEGPGQARGDPRSGQAPVHHAGLRRRAAWTRSRPRPASPSSPSTAISATRKRCSPRRCRRIASSSCPTRCSPPPTPRRCASGLLQIARAVLRDDHASPRRVAGHRIMCTPQVVDPPMPQLFWEAGPQRVQDALAEFLRAPRRRGRAGDRRRRTARPRSSSAWLKGELHAQLVFGCCTSRPRATRSKPSWKAPSTCSCAPMPRRPTRARIDRMTSVLLTSGTQYRVCYHSDAVARHGPPARKIAGFPRETVHDR